MAYSEQLVQLIREALASRTDIEEKQMFQGLTFMVNGKMCIGVREDEIMFRVDPALFESLVERAECRPMIHGKRTMKGFFFVSEQGYRRPEIFNYWLQLALDFNPRAKASRKKAK